MEAKTITSQALEKFFKDSYPHDTDRTDYVWYLREMNHKTSIKQLVNTYDKLLNKILSLKYRAFSAPRNWYEYDYLPKETSSLFIELGFLLNEHIERLFNSNNDFTKNKVLQFLVNLRPAPNRDLIMDHIMTQCPGSTRDSIDIEELKNSFNIKEDAPNHLGPYNIETNGYKDYLPRYIKEMKNLIKLGYIKDYRDSTFEIEAKINYIADVKSVLLFILVVLIILAVFAFLMWLLSDLGFLIIILIGFPGALIGFLKRG